MADYRISQSLVIHSSKTSTRDELKALVQRLINSTLDFGNLTYSYTEISQ